MDLSNRACPWPKPSALAGCAHPCIHTLAITFFLNAPQFVREFAKLGLTRSVGGVLALALSRELTPVVTAIILAGRVGSAFAAELGTMQVRLLTTCIWCKCCTALCLSSYAHVPHERHESQPGKAIR